MKDKYDYEHYIMYDKYDIEHYNKHYIKLYVCEL